MAVVRRARPGDEKRIAEFALMLFEQHVEYDPDRFSAFATAEGAESFYRNRFTTAESAVIVAEKDGELIGFAYVEKDERNYAELLENGAWLHDIYVAGSARAEGVGRALIAAAATAAKALGADKLLLTVAARNENAQQVFEKAGFRQTMLEMTLNI